MSLISSAAVEPDATAAPRPPAFAATGPRRVATLGMAVGGIGFPFAIALALTAGGVEEAVFNFDRAPALAIFIVALPLGAVALNALLIFYGVRLLLWVRRRPLAEVIGQLRKFRTVCAPLLVLTLLQLVAGSSPDSSLSLPFTALSVLCGVGICVTLLESRRVAWDLALAAGATFTTGRGTGFQVLAPATPFTPEALVEPPAFSAPRPVTALPVEPLSPGGESRPALPAAAEDRAALADWEKLLTAVLLAVIVLYLLQLPAFFHRLGAYTSPDFWREFWSAAAGTTPPPRARLGGLAAAGGGASGLTLLLIGASAASGAAALVWVLWAMACLTLGPRLRRAAVYFAGAAIGLAVVTAGVTLYQYQLMIRQTVQGTYSRAWRQLYSRQWSQAFQAGNPFGNVSPDSDTLLEDARQEILRRAATDAALPFLLLVVLTRQPVKHLFAHRPRRVRGEGGDRG